MNPNQQRKCLTDYDVGRFCVDEAEVKGVCFKCGIKSKKILCPDCLNMKSTEGNIRNSSTFYNKEGLIEYKGKAQAVKAWAKEYNMKAPTLAGRLYKGIPIHEALTMPVEPRPEKGKKHRYKGRSMTLAEWSREKGFDRNILVRRLNKGMKLKDALEMPVARRIKSINPYSKRK